VRARAHPGGIVDLSVGTPVDPTPAVVQAALARGRAPHAAIAWLVAAALFVALVAAPTIANVVTRVEVGYFTAALVLSGLLLFVYRRGAATPGGAAAVPTPPS